MVKLLEKMDYEMNEMNKYCVYLPNVLNPKEKILLSNMYSTRSPFIFIFVSVA